MQSFASVEEQFRLLMESVTDYSIFFADAHGTITTWNVGAERILGWTEAEIIGQNLSIIFTPEDRAVGNDAREMGTATATGRADDERWHLKKDGSRFWASGILTALYDSVGNLRGYCKILRDLTERKRWEEEQQAAQAKREHVVDVLQQSLLMVPPPDAFPGLTVKPLYVAASNDALVGGDFFDVFAVAEDTIALVVGDATGHGIEAVTYTAEVKFALRAFLRESPSPADALHRLNGFVAGRDRLDPRHLGTSYVALSLCVINTRQRVLTCTWGGIEPPFVVRADRGEIVELLHCSGPLIGVDTAARYREETVSLLPGDVLAMTTDGLTEARRAKNGKREFFGYDGLTRAVCESLEGYASSLADAAAAVAQRAKDFAGGTISDDVCLLLARCL